MARSPARIASKSSSFIGPDGTSPAPGRGAKLSAARSSAPHEAQRRTKLSAARGSASYEAQPARSPRRRAPGAPGGPVAGPTRECSRRWPPATWWVAGIRRRETAPDSSIPCDQERLAPAREIGSRTFIRCRSDRENGPLGPQPERSGREHSSGAGRIGRTGHLGHAAARFSVARGSACRIGADGPRGPGLTASRRLYRSSGDVWSARDRGSSRHVRALGRRATPCWMATRTRGAGASPGEASPGARAKRRGPGRRCCWPRSSRPKEPRAEGGSADTGGPAEGGLADSEAGWRRRAGPAERAPSDGGPAAPSSAAADRASAHEFKRPRPRPASWPISATFRWAGAASPSAVRRPASTARGSSR